MAEFFFVGILFGSSVFSVLLRIRMRNARWLEPQSAEESGETSKGPAGKAPSDGHPLLADIVQDDAGKPGAAGGGHSKRPGSFRLFVISWWGISVISGAAAVLAMVVVALILGE